MSTDSEMRRTNAVALDLIRSYVRDANDDFEAQLIDIWSGGVREVGRAIIGLCHFADAALDKVITDAGGFHDDVDVKLHILRVLEAAIEYDG